MGGSGPTIKRGRRPAVSAGDVAAAIGELRAAGEEPTERAVRRIVGRGSFTTIGPLYREAMAAEAEPGGTAAPAARIAGLEAELASERRARRDSEAGRLEAVRDAAEARAEIDGLKAALSYATEAREKAEKSLRRAAAAEAKRKAAEAGRRAAEAGKIAEARKRAELAEKEAKLAEADAAKSRAEAAREREAERRGHVGRLREENKRLKEENRRLQFRLDEFARMVGRV